MTNIFWPSIDTVDEAKKICRTAAGMAFFVAIVTAVVVWAQVSGKIKLFEGFDQWAYIDAALFFIIGLGLLWCSRIAAVTGLLLYIAERVVLFQQTGIKASQVFLPIIITLAFIGGVRGAFAYHALKNKERAEEAEASAPAVDPEAEAPVPQKNKRNAWVAAVLLLGLAGALIGGGVFFMANKASSPKDDAANTGASENLLETKPPGQGVPQRIFHLKSGETVKGTVIREDETYYTVEVFGKAERYVIKEDIAKEG